MSDRIPFEIQVEIIKRLPVKSLIRFRSVSKPWKCLIDSSQFIADYSVHHSQPQHLLVRYKDPADSEVKYVLIDDDADTFPQRKCSLDVPVFIKSSYNLEIIGSSHGLLCFYQKFYGFGNVFLWNPSIQKSVVINMLNELRSPYETDELRRQYEIDELSRRYETFVAFGVCPHTNDPKILKINSIFSYRDDLECISCTPLQVEVFTLSSRAWSPSRNLPRKVVSFYSCHIVINGFIYWPAFDRTIVNDEFEDCNLIISFDLTSEEFGEIYVPDYLAQGSRYIGPISKLRDSLVVLNCGGSFVERVYDVWMMEHGVPYSFIKLFTIDASNAALNPPNAALNPFLGFRENGEALLQTVNRDEESAAVEVYDPSSKHIKDLGIYGILNSFFVRSYMETLILLDQPARF